MSDEEPEDNFRSCDQCLLARVRFGLCSSTLGNRDSSPTAEDCCCLIELTINLEYVFLAA